jgi:methyl-accepting chemotaxis protein
MASNWTFGKKLALGFAVPAVVLLVISVAAYRTTESQLEDAKWVDHSQLVRRLIARLVADLGELEVSQRSFIITGDSSYLDAYAAAQTTILATYEELRTATRDNATQQPRLLALKPLIEQRIAIAAANIEIRRDEGLEAAVARISTGKARTASEQLRRAADQIDETERLLLEQRRAQAETSASTVQAVIVWGCIAGLGLVVLFGTLIARSLATQLGAAASRMQSSSSELQAAASQQASGAKEQATAMAEITTTISELLATARQIAESSQRVSQIAEQTAGSARVGQGTVERSHESMTGIRRQVDLIVANMLELGKKSQHIGAVLDIVSELSEQTNILSINATIEAAGAGEAGKRFAVVADEIRKLADRVSGSTKEIRGLIEDIRASVNTTVMTTESGSKAVDAGARQLADVATAFKQIAGLVGTTTDAAREIELSTKQQSTAVEQVNIAVANVAQATRENEASSVQTLQTSAELTKLSGDLLRIVQRQTR